MKILDIVKFNDGVAFVVDEMPTLTYEKMTAPVSACEGEYEKFTFAGREFLIGRDESGVFYDVLYHRVEPGGRKAFAGREFSLPMKNGETFKTDGWWWDGGLSVAARMLGIEMGRVTIQDRASLAKCFVFTARCMDVKMFDERLYRPFVDEHGKIEPRDYHEFEREMRFTGRQKGKEVTQNA